MTAKSIGKYKNQSLRTIKAHGGSHEKACDGSSIKKHPIPKEPSLLQQSAEEWLHDALRAMEIMHRQGTPIHVDIIHHLLQECLRKKNLSASCLFHSLLVSIGLDSVGFFGDHLIRLFALCGSLMKGHGVFCKNPYPTLYTWNAILTAHVQLESSEKAIELFHKMKGEGVEPDKFTFLAILKACCRLLASRQGRLLHAHIMVKSLETDNLIGSTLVHMYAKCGCMDDACRVFDSLVNRDVVTWNAVIGGYVQCGLHVRAFKLIEEMQQKGLILNEVTFCCLLKACGNVGVPKETKNLIHDQIIRQRLESVAVVGNGIVDMYAKCGDLAVAREVFETLKHRDVVSWNAMMAGYVQNENGWMALQLFSEMQQAGPKPDKVTFSSILQACGSIGALEHGKLIHCLIIESGIKANVVVEKMLVDMYAKCGSLSDGCKVFGDLQSGDVVLWNSIIAGYTQNGDSAAALVLFGRMQRRGIHPNDVTYTWVLKACNNEEDIREGKVLHDEIIRCGLESNACIGSSLIDMYVKCGSLDEGQEVFDRLPNQDTVLWNTIIAAYAQAQKALLALQLFKKMQFKGIKPDSFTFSCIMKACSDIKDIESGMLIHDHVVRSEYERDIVVGNSLVDMYGKFGNKEESYSVFQRLATRDVVSWNAFITGCAQNENGLFVLEHFQRMQEESIKPDQITYACALKVCGNIGAIVQGRLVHDQVLRSGLESGVAIKSHLVDMYIQFGSLWEGSKTFGDMQTQSWAPWNAMIVGHALHGSGLSSFEWFVKMQMEGVQPEKGTYLAVLKACADLGARVQGRSVHDQMIRSGCEIDLIIGSTLVDMYSKCGSIAEASMLFDRLPIRDVVSWNVMIAGYTRHGDYSQAERCLEEMQRHGLKPDDRTYSSILAACSRSGKADEGHQYFLSMRESYGVTPDTRHFTCMVDLLSRAGRLDEAEVLLKSLPGLPDLPGWRALLSACRAHGDMDLGRQCYFQAILSNPENSSGYVLMSNIYADAYMLEDAHEIQGQRIASGAWKMPGKAWIEIKRSVHEFTVGEKSLPQSDNIFSKLKKLSRTMDAEGHVPQVGMVLGWVPDEDGNALHACLAP